MKFAVVADIHANLSALEAVLRDIEERGGVDGIWCLGDIVGYGPDPRQCISLVQKIGSSCIAGNHDWAAIGKVDLAEFNNEAAAAVRWTRCQLTYSEIEYLAGLPLLLERDKFTLAHGSPRYPVWEYILTADEAEANFACFKTPYSLVGHSHLPLLFEIEECAASIENENRIKAVQRKLSEGCPQELRQRRAIINPGGVGQPRDDDPRASYGLYDDQSCTFTLFRVSYDIPAVQSRMAAAGLPSRLIERLDYGW